MLDVIVVGGSFAGLSAALQLGRARRRVLIVDAGQPRNRFAHASHGFPGQDGRPPTEILASFRTQVLAYPTVQLRHHEAVDAFVEEGGFAVQLASGEVVRSQRLVLASGVVDELPSIPGLAERWGRSVLHCPYCHGYEVADGRLGVLATSEKSLHQALLLPDWSPQVTLFTNGAFTPGAEQLAQLDARGVLIDPRPVEAIVGEGRGLSGVRMQGGDVVALDALFTGSRTRPSSDIAERLGCAFQEGTSGPFVSTDDRQETDVPGVYAAGDHARGAHTVSWAVGDGVAAGIAAHQSLALAIAIPAH